MPKIWGLTNFHSGLGAARQNATQVEPKSYQLMQLSIFSTSLLKKMAGLVFVSGLVLMNISGLSAAPTLTVDLPDGPLAHHLLASLGTGSLGSKPEGSLIQAGDGSFYGLTPLGGSANKGTVIKVAPTGVVTTLAEFGSLGANGGAKPFGSLVEGADGKLYGMTSEGGTSNFGTVFSVSLEGTLATVFNFTVSTGTLPRGDLMLASDGNFYGMTWNRGETGPGPQSRGTIFKMTPSGEVTVLKAFTISGTTFPHGSNPTGSLIEASDGHLYGMTSRGGSSDSGTIFRLTTGGVFTSLVSFTGLDGTHPGSEPSGSLVQASDGHLYGVTGNGGAGGRGTLFRLTTAGIHSVLVELTDESPFMHPSRSLIQAPDGDLYGLAFDSGDGAVFKSSLTGSIERVLSFTGTSGNNRGRSPLGSLLAANGSLYGLTQSGGQGSNNGTVFRLSPSPGTIEVDEGQLATVTGTFSDEGGAAGVTLHASSGSLERDDAAGTWSWSDTKPDGPVTVPITITATNSAMESVQKPFTFRVKNRAPQLSFSAPATAPLNHADLAVTISATDVPADQAAGFYWEVDFGDGSDIVYVPSGIASPLNLRRTFAQVGTYQIAATATDKDGGKSAVTTHSITITPAELAVSGNGIAILNGDKTPATVDHTFLGQSDAAPITRSYTIQNLGVGPLAVEPVVVSAASGGVGEQDFVVQQQPSSPIPAGGSSSFSVVFTPSAAGLRSAHLNFGYGETNMFSFTIQARSGLPGPGEVGPLELDLRGPFAWNLPLWGSVMTTVAQQDGKTLLGGYFFRVLGKARSNLARLKADGTLDETFLPNPDRSVESIIVLPDGRLLVAGSFLEISGVERNGIALLKSDGSLELGFNPNINGTVNCMALQADGKILVGGNFDRVQPNGASSPTTRNYLARFNANGTLDTSFNPNPNYIVSSLAIQPDGRILVGGHFETFNPNGSATSIERRYVARLNVNGTVDLTFYPTELNDPFYPRSFGPTAVVALQPDGKILVGGLYESVRLHANGRLDTDFDPNPIGSVNSIALQSNGKVIFGGAFTTLEPNDTGSVTRNRLARVGADGAVDMNFDSNVNDEVMGLTLQGDGSATLGGRFTALQPNGAGQPAQRLFFARVHLEDSPHDFAAVSGNQILWTPGGTAPVVSTPTFLQSDDDGGTWRQVGIGQPVAGTQGWRLTGLNLTNGSRLRAVWRTVSGMGNGSSGYAIAESAPLDLPLPVLALPTASNFTATSAKLDGEVISDGGQNVIERGFVFARTAINANPLIGANGVIRVQVGQGIGTFSFNANSLLPGAGYSLRSYAISGFGTSYSQVASFSTLPPAPKIEVQLLGGGLLADNDTVDFGAEALASKTRRDFIVRNVGTAPLSIQSVNFTGDGSTSYGATGLTTNTLAPGASLTLIVTFIPSSLDSNNATFNIETSDPLLPTHRVQVTGTGLIPTPPALEVVREMPLTSLDDNGAAVDFGNVLLGGTSTITFTIKNAAVGKLTDLAVTGFGSNAADFLITPLVTDVVGAYGSTSFSVTLRPSARGPRQATLRIASNDNTKQPFFRINVSGNGVAPEIDINQGTTALVDAKGTVSFGTAVAVGSPAVRTFTITNNGTADLLLGAVVVDGAHAAEFIAGAPGLAVLTPGASTTLDVTFTPTAAGARTAALHLLSNDGDESPFDIKLIGTGTGARLQVEQPVKVVLGHNANVDFGNVVEAASAVRLFTLRNVGSAPLTGISVVSDTAQFVVGTVPATLAPKASANVAVTFNPDSAASFAATLTLTSNDAIEGSFLIPVQGKGVAAAAPVIAPGPQSQIIALGQPVTFSATVSSEVAFTRQWQRGVASFSNISKATAASFTIPAVKLADAASFYRLRAANTAGGLFSESPAAALTVVDRKASKFNLGTTKTATLTVAAAGSSALTYVWKKNGDPIPADARYNGDGTNKLVISNLELDDAGTYICEVSGPGGMMSSGDNVLTVFADAPVIVGNPLVLPPTIIGGQYSFFIPLDPDRGSATSFTCSGLPKGLKLNGTTGEIFGQPTASKAEPYSLTITAKNASGTSKVTGSLLVSPLPPGAAGTYLGIIGRGPVTDALGGRIDLTISESGGYSGKVALGGGKALPFPAGTVTATPGSNEISLSIVVPRKGMSPIMIEMAINTLANRFVLGRCTIAVDADEDRFEGWRNAWSAATKAEAYRGYYTFALDVPETDPVDLATPQGLGYGSFTAPLDGKVFTVSGRVADNDAFTGSFFLGPDGEVPLFAALPSKGSLVGHTQIMLGTAPAYQNNTLTAGTLTWSRPASTAANAAVYKAGFEPVALTVEGGRYLPPVAPLALMNRVVGDNNAALGFFDAGIGGPSSSADRLVTLKAGAKVTVAAAGPAQTTLTAISATGLFNGGFTLVVPHPFLSGAPLITRRSTYQGIIIPTANGYRGRGFFMLQQLPENIFPQPPALPMLSGGVVFE